MIARSKDGMYSIFSVITFDKIEMIDTEKSFIGLLI